MQNVSSKFPGVGNPASPDMVGLGDPGAMTRVRPGAHGGAGRWVQILLGGAGRGAQVCTPVRPCHIARLQQTEMQLLLQSKSHLLPAATVQQLQHSVVP
jgi:hypothetical protein